MPIWFPDRERGKAILGQLGALPGLEMIIICELKNNKITIIACICFSANSPSPKPIFA